MDNTQFNVDYLEAGSIGPLVVLVHATATGARQWRHLMDNLKPDFRVRAVNLFGYGKTPPWARAVAQSLEDQARLVEAAIPEDVEEVFLVGHSFGGSVAMKAADRMQGRVTKLVLLEANPFHLLAQEKCMEAFAEAIALRDCVKRYGALGEWHTAAERFATYWNGSTAWKDMPAERRAAFAEMLKPSFFEWDAVMDEVTSVAQWASRLPRATIQINDPDTALPIREIAKIFRRSCPWWDYADVPGVGHMAPLTRPDVIDPLVRSYLEK